MKEEEEEEEEGEGEGKEFEYYLGSKWKCIMFVPLLYACSYMEEDNSLREKEEERCPLVLNYVGDRSKIWFHIFVKYWAYKIVR